VNEQSEPLVMAYAKARRARSEAEQGVNNLVRLVQQAADALKNWDRRPLRLPGPGGMGAERVGPGSAKSYPPGVAPVAETETPIILEHVRGFPGGERLAKALEDYQRARQQEQEAWDRLSADWKQTFADGPRGQ
jgi:hypothetical protein